MLLKNFGVTRHGRVVFYDYDEIVPLMDCNFRDSGTAHRDGGDGQPALVLRRPERYLSRGIPPVLLGQPARAQGL
jgi:hypothetical protein